MAATMANGKKMEFIEGIRLKFQTCKSDIRLNTYVCPKLGYELVLGTDFLLQNKLNIDFERKKIRRIQNSTLTGSRSAKLPVNSIITLYTKIPSYATEGYAVFEPHPSWIARGLLIPRQLVTVDHNKPVMPVKITNCTTSTTPLYKANHWIF
jgi:hypothetical protein